jgi:HAD superfamily hydrolase (TIGR01490 family)
VTDPMRLGVAAFDFDGTLVAGDSFLPFLVRLRGARPVARQFVVSTVGVGLAGGLRLDRDASKADLVARLLTGYPAARLAEEGETFGRHLVGRIRSSMRTRLEWHRARGHRLLLVSASPGCYLEPFGRCLELDAVLATQFEVGPDGRLTGRLEGANCRGVEKATRVRAWLDEHLVGAVPEVWAYGDSAGDRELLGLADHPRRIRRRDQLIGRG